MGSLQKAVWAIKKIAFENLSFFSLRPQGVEIVEIKVAPNGCR